MLWVIINIIFSIEIFQEVIHEKKILLKSIMTHNNYIEDDEYYQDLKEFMIKNFDIYITRSIYDIDENIIIK